MQNDKNITVQTYNHSAEKFAAKFNSMLGRVKDIVEVFSFFPNNKDLKVFELGCGNGRDAAVINKLTNNYLGLDASDELLSIAREDNPNLKFVLADFLSFDYPKNIDIVFAFASLIHLDKKEMERVFIKVAGCLNQGGIFRISLKGGNYQRIEQEDNLGKRIYFLYTEEDINEMASNYFEVTKSETRDYQHNSWVEMTLRKT